MELLAPKKPPRGAVLVIHSWWGLTDSFRRFGERLRREGFAVGLTDLFDGETATTEAAARKLRGKRRSRPMYRELERNIESLRAVAGGKRLGVVGFSMGGHWAVWLSQRPEYGVSATVLYYAARAGSFARSSSAYLAHFAAQDPWVSRSARRNMETALTRAERPYEPFDYAETGHWFAEPARADAYHPRAATKALRRTLDFLTREL